MKRAEMNLELLAAALATSARCCMNKRDDIGYDRPAADVPTPVEIVVSDCYCYGYEESTVDVWAGLTWGRARDTYEDDGSFAIFRDAAGKLWAFEEWADTTGHGCRCGSSLQEFPDLSSAMMLGLGRDNRERAAVLLAEKGIPWTPTQP